MGGRHHDRRMGPDRDRERQPSALPKGAVVEQLQIARADQIDAGLAPGPDHQPIGAGIAAILRVAGNADAGGDVRTAVEIADQRHRQRREVDVVALEDDVADRSGIHHHGRPAFADPLQEGLADVAVMAVERRPHAGAGADDAGHDADVVAAHARKPQGRFGCRDVRRDVPQVDLFGDLHQLADRDQLFQIVTKPCRHFRPRLGVKDRNSIGLNLEHFSMRWDPRRGDLCGRPIAGRRGARTGRPQGSPLQQAMLEKPFVGAPPTYDFG